MRSAASRPRCYETFSFSSRKNANFRPKEPENMPRHPSGAR
jgi:hypothetical protein